MDLSSMPNGANGPPFGMDEVQGSSATDLHGVSPRGGDSMDRAHRLALWMWGTPRRAVCTTVAAVVILSAAITQVPALGQVAVWLVVSSPLALLVAAFPNEFKQLIARALGHVATFHARLELESVRQDL